MQTYGTKLTVCERSNEFTGRYAACVEELGAELGLPSLNLWQAFQAVPGWQRRLLNDGLHFTEEGNAELYRLLQRLLDDRYPDLR
jgi:lysophospholipase L1-like esterase